MSSRYVATGKALATAANTNILSIRSSSTGRVNVEEVHLFTEAATAWVAPSLFMTTVVDTAGTAVAGQKEDPSLASPSAVVSTLPTGGTLAAVAVRRRALAGAIGSGLMWLWPSSSALVVPLNLSMVIRNDGVLGPAVTWVIVWSE